jgi:hypothetical protein
MGLIWVHELDGWSVLRLDERPVRLDVSPLRVLQDREVGVGGDFPVALVFSDKDKPQWAVIAAEGTGVRVNGRALSTGMHILADRDEMQVGRGRSFFFSTETLASIDPFPGMEHIFCPRCQLSIVESSPAVRCPQCGVWYHMSEEYPCWRYDEKCQFCDQRTAEDAVYRWTPEEI